VYSSASHREVPSKIEITIVKVSVPGNRDERSAHQPFNGTRIEAGSKTLQVALKIPRLQKPLAESSQRHVGKRKEPVKDDAPSLQEHFTESFLDQCLGGREESPGRIAYQMEFQSRLFYSISQAVELLQGSKACAESPRASLGISLMFVKRRERGDDDHLIGLEETDQVLSLVLG
jgi:hypothetical protein